ncbi:MAG: anti-sigma factor family protein [Terriglobia bacterium]
MNCHEVQPFVSALHDGQSVPREAAEHMRSCLACQARLEDYARMDVELRLLASSAPEEATTQMPHLPQIRRRWGHTLTARMLVPRFALGVGLFAILGLSVGLGWVRAQSGGPWFQFDLSNAEKNLSVGCLTQAGDDCQGFVTTAANQKIGIRVKALDVQKDLARLSVKARVFEPVPGNEEVEAKHQAGGLSQEVIDRMFANTTPQEFDYVPGQTLEIPVEGGGKVLLSGEVFKLRPSFSAQWYPLTLQPNEIALSKAALVRGNQFLGEIEGGGSARGENSAIGICVPPVGAFVFGLKPFDGAVHGVAEFGEVRFNLDGDQYTLFSATPITGGQQPREIWVYRSQNCMPSWKTTPKHPSMIGSGSISNVLDLLRK